jgi:hypothetical protein
MKFLVRVAAAAVLTVSVVAIGAAHSVAFAGHTQKGKPSVAITSLIGTVDSPVRWNGNGLTITIKASNVDLTKGHGGWEAFVDSIVPSALTKTLVASGTGTKVHVTREELTAVGATTGIHTLYIVLTTVRHVFLKPMATASTVLLLGPSLVLQEHGTMAHPIMILTSGIVTFHVAVRGFTLSVANMNKKEVAGEGHYHLYIDSIDPSQPFAHYVSCFCDPPVTQPGLSFSITAAQLARRPGVGPGLHTMYVTLNTNFHNLVGPVTGDSAVIDVQG